MDNNKKIAVTATNISLLKKAEYLALGLNLPLITSVENLVDFKFLLTLSPERLELRENCSKTAKSVFVDFLSPQIRYRIKHGGGKNQLLARALGIKNQKNLTVIDATAGLGVDAFVISSLGCRVTMLERSGVVAALLEDGLGRLKAKISDLELSFIATEAEVYFSTILTGKYVKPDVIYLDPMYPERAKSALNKKSMRILHEIVGDDSDAEGLLELALKVAQKRVAVKRPKMANYLANKQPDLQFIASGSSRFDVYLSKHS